MLTAVAALLLWLGSTLLLAHIRWFARTPLRRRLAAHLPGGTRGWPGSLATAPTMAELVADLADTLGARASRCLGVSEALDRRLRRIHAPFDVTAFRLRQLGWSMCAVGVAAMVVVGARPPPILGVVILLGAPMLAFVTLEQQVSAASRRWRASLRSEIPVVAEQIAMLLGAGRSVTSALERVASRGRGTVARDLGDVVRRVHHGVDEQRALREWSELAEVDAVDRFVAVLCLHQSAGDLGRLIAVEARGIRRDVHRDLLEVMERRAQQVWVPVTVATLLPGVLFLGIPFISALDGFLT